MEMGLWWFRSIRENELAGACAANPHDLGKVLDVENRLTIGEIILHLSLAREASSPRLGLNRLDYPENGDDCGYYIAVSQNNDDVVVDRIPYYYWRSEGSCRACYENHCCKGD
jgi:hypothetical protein